MSEHSQISARICVCGSYAFTHHRECARRHDYGHDRDRDSRYCRTGRGSDCAPFPTSYLCIGVGVMLCVSGRIGKLRDDVSARKVLVSCCKVSRGRFKHRPCGNDNPTSWQRPHIFNTAAPRTPSPLCSSAEPVSPKHSIPP